VTSFLTAVGRQAGDAYARDDSAIGRLRRALEPTNGPA
jgi:hypothetical protein